MHDVFIFLMILSLAFGSCKRETCPILYEFHFPITISAQDTFTIGDTIWMTLDVPNHFMDYNSGEWVDATNFELFFSFFIEQVDTTRPITGRDDLQSFTVIEELGRLEQNSSIVSFVHLKTQTLTQKQGRIGLIPNMAATYALDFGFPSAYWNPADGDLDLSDGSCPENITEKSKIKVNNGETNHYLVAGKCGYTMDGRRVCYKSKEEHVNNGGYAFHVKAP